MPDLALAHSHGDTADLNRLSEHAHSRSQRHSMWSHLPLHKFGGWLKKEKREHSSTSPGPDVHFDEKSDVRPPAAQRRPGKDVVPGLPRPITFHRQNSEQRDRLLPYQPCAEERRAISADRKAGLVQQRTRSPPARPAYHRHSISAPSVREVTDANDYDAVRSWRTQSWADRPAPWEGDFDESQSNALSREPTLDPLPESEALSAALDDLALREEQEAKWILNLSMHFRDRSEREKFFVTYAEQPNSWRRVTVSCDYRDAPPQSLEADLKTLHFQRDKSSRMYEAIHESLADVQFYDTVTNLKLETDRDGGRLHVHVTEDVNEIISYPQASTMHHVSGPRIRESSVVFDSHMSGFVYKVFVDGTPFIKKEIPGPDAVEEFLYEINALYALRDSDHVISFEGLVVDETGEFLKGLLIGLADHGALVDILFESRGSSFLGWKRRERWAKQIVHGLSQVHESGFVQGDFTLSNIVIDQDDNARIIDINRRGCPVGWEPPELQQLIVNGQRVSMFIGNKSDLFQLGMVLWALAEECDEPERQERPLLFTPASHHVPKYFKDIILSCLCPDPRGRRSAKDLLATFPELDSEGAGGKMTGNVRHALILRPEKEYIDPATAVDLDDIEESRSHRLRGVSSGFSSGGMTFAVPASDDYGYDGPEPRLVERRGRSPFVRGSRVYPDSPYARPISCSSKAPSELGKDSLALSETHTPDDNTPSTTECGAVPSVLPSAEADLQRTFSPPMHQDSGFNEPVMASARSSYATADTEKEDGTQR